MDQLRESLDLPKIGGEIIAYTRLEYGTTRNGCLPFSRRELKPQYKRILDWKVRFEFPGPDSRYNPGVAELTDQVIDNFIKDLGQALNKMAALKKQSFSGTYSKSFESHHYLRYPKIEVKASDGVVWLQFWVSSKTYSFSRSLSSDEVSIAISKLKKVRGKAQEMIETLKTLV